MKTWCRKILRVVAVCSAFLFFAFSAQAQITNVVVDPGPYTPGSTIAATFSIGSTCIKPGNVFNLYLVSSTGVETPIGKYNGFYTTFVNGIIPSVTAPGTGYFLRVKSTSPVYTADSAPFNIVSGGAVLAEVKSFPELAYDNKGKAEVFGYCPGIDDKEFSFANASSENSIVTGTVKNEITGTILSPLIFSGAAPDPSFMATLGHYTMVISARLNGTIATRAYLVVNNNIKNSFGTSGGNIVCLPGGFLQYSVDLTAETGIKNNFPGTTYSIKWGDGTIEVYTLCDLAAGFVRHEYTRSSCGQPVYNTGGGNQYNVFGINIAAVSPFCPDAGGAISTYAKVVTKPENKFSAPVAACTGSNVTFTNNSIAGQTIQNTVSCVDNNVRYNWYVDNIKIASNKLLNDLVTHTFGAPGVYTIKLESVISGQCNADPVFRTICIQDPPKPAFDFNNAPQTGCAPFSIQAFDKSTIDSRCNSNNTYNWIVTPSAGVVFDHTAKDPVFQFNNPGKYTIELEIITASCGAVKSGLPLTIILADGVPTVTLSKDITLCGLGTYNFDVNSGSTTSIFTGTTQAIPNYTYTWSVTEANGDPLAPGDYSFENPTDFHSQNPKIKFNKYKTYKIKAINKNTCGTGEDEQLITFLESPVPNITVNPEPICYNAQANLTGTISNSNYRDYKWSTTPAGGTFVNEGTLTPTYIPSAADIAAQKATVTLTITTNLSGSCASIPYSKEIIIFPNNTGVNSEQTICTGTSPNFILKSSIPGSTFSWVATNPDGYISGLVSSGTSDINNILNNTNLTQDGIVIYKITPSANGCTGTSFNFTVTVKAKSVGGSTVASNNDVCAGANSGSITLSGQVGDIVGWQTSVDGGQTWGPIISSTANPYVFSNLNQTTEFRAIVQNGVCNVATSTITTLVVNPAIPDADAGKNIFLCGGNSTILNGNKVNAAYTGTWTQTSSQTGVSITNPLLFNTTVTGLVPGETYIFRWTISGAATCAPKSSDVTVNVYNLLTNTITTVATEVCAGQSILITGDTPTGGNGTYTYQWQVSADGTTWNDISGQAGPNQNIAITASSFYRRVVNSDVCTSNSNVVEIKTLPVLGNNKITTADQTICLGAVAPELIATVPTGGSGTYLYQWESSIDNGNTWIAVSGATDINFTPPIPTATILYRRLVASGTCSDLSNQVKITVNPPAKAEFTFITNVGCNPFVLTAANIKATPYPDRNNTYTWFADGVLIPNGTGINFPGFTIVGDNKTVEIKLVVTSSLGCNSSETTHTFSTQANVTASYTQNVTQGCGPLSVTFNNTSNSPSAATFKWDFGNGTTSNQAQPPAVTFQPDPTGKDITYTITLSAITPCGVTTKTSTVFVQGKPVSIFSPDKTTGCSPFPVNFSNTSPESSGTTYTFDFDDGSPLLVTRDRNSVSHVFTTTVVRDYKVTMTAENACGKSTTSYTIRVAPNDITPELVVNASELSGCAPFTVNFYNNTKGASKFAYDFGDETGLQYTNSAPETVNHIFTKPGTYTVTLYASNDCSNAQTTETITVLAQPTVEFTADKTGICDGGLVKFRNTSKNVIGYKWDFGDGTTSFAFEPEHIYTGTGQNYTVKLTTTNALGCSNTLILTDYIKVAPELKSIFTVLPGNELSIPNFTFSFRDASLNAGGSWEWSFGDGTVSTLQNPTHTYANVGDYTVTLKVLNKEGCSAISTQAVRIIGVPGFLYVPNSFMPGSAKNELQTFKAKGRGIDNWTMTIFNKWGQVLWETTKLDDGAPLESWDGTYKGQPQPQGVYFWKIEVKFINGSEWKGMTYDSSPPKKTGNIYLIR